MKKYLNFIISIVLFLIIGYCAPAIFKNSSLNQLSLLKITVFILMVLVIVIGIFFVIKDIKKGSGVFGLNFDKGICPRCKKKNTKIFRIPKRKGQILKGEWTCEFCGCEIDHWNKEIK